MPGSVAHRKRPDPKARFIQLNAAGLATWFQKPTMLAKTGTENNSVPVFAEFGELARKLVERALLREGCWHNPPILHSDNGAPMTSYMLKARLAELGMLMSHSRPRVSNDNPYSESLFRTVKYCPEWPLKGFKSLTAVRNWMLAFEYAYNEQHLHSSIRFVTPTDRHRGVDHERLAHRKRVYERSKRRNPRRWSGNTRNWEATGPVSLNPGKLQEIERNKLAA